MNWKKRFAIILAPIMLVCLTEGNQSVQAQAAVRKTEEKMLQIALERLETAESMHSDLTMDMEVKVFGLKTGMEATMDMTSFRSPVRLKADISLDLGILGSTNLEVYAKEQEESFRLYLKDGGGWRAGTVEASQLCRFDGRQLMQVYLEQIENLKLADAGTLNGKKVYHFTSVVQSEGFKELLVDTGSLRLLSALFGDTMLSSLGNLLSQEDEVSALMDRVQDIKADLWIDAGTGDAVRFSMDITEMLRDAYDMLFGTGDSDKSGNGIWSKIEVTKTELVLNCSEINEAEEITIPKAALKAAAK